MTLYVVSVYLHILAAATWVGGIIFLVAIAVPAMRRLEKGAAATMLRTAVYRFRTIGWISFAVLLLTGLYNLHFRGIGWREITSPEYRTYASGKALLIKLACFALIVILQAWHDFSIGPRALDTESPKLRKLAGMIGRINGIVTLVVVFCAVVVVRGC